MTEFPVGEHRGWEDSYWGQCFSTFEELREHSRIWVDTSYARLNWPVWVEYDAENEQEWDVGPTVSVGVFMHRKGNSSQFIAPATPEQAQEMSRLLMQVWARRADMHFRRYVPEPMVV